MPYTASRVSSLESATPLESAASFIQLDRQLRQKPARFIRSMFCTSVRARRCSTRRRNTAASGSVWVLSSMSAFLKVSPEDKREWPVPLLVLWRQADIVLRDGQPSGARGEQVIQFGELHVAFERRVAGEAMQQRGHVPGIAHDLPHAAQAGVGIAVEPR